MKTAIIAKVRGLTIVMLLLLAVSVAPVVACEPGTPCAGNDAIASKPVIKELSGNEAAQYIDKATQGQNFKKLEGELLKLGYKEQEKRAFRVQVTNKEGSVDEINVVAMVYGNETEQKTILYMVNDKTGVTSTALVKGNAATSGILMCVFSAGLCVVTCVGCLGVCAAESIESDDGFWCALCMLGACPLTCGVAICECTDSCCAAGNQWCCQQHAYC